MTKSVEIMPLTVKTPESFHVASDLAWWVLDMFSDEVHKSVFFCFYVKMWVLRGESTKQQITKNENNHPSVHTNELLGFQQILQVFDSKTHQTQAETETTNQSCQSCEISVTHRVAPPSSALKRLQETNRKHRPGGWGYHVMIIMRNKMVSWWWWWWWWCMGQNDANILTMSVTVVRRDNYHDDVCNSVYILYVYIYIWWRCNNHMQYISETKSVSFHTCKGQLIHVSHYQYGAVG